MVHGAPPGSAHGHAYVVDLERQAVFNPLQAAAEDIEWLGEEGGRGLRGIAFDGETVYIAASNRLLAYDRQFRLLDSWDNPCLVNGRGLCIYQRKLYLACAGNDCILGFDLDGKSFDWALHIRSERFEFSPILFDPAGGDTPLQVSKLQLRTVDCDTGGMRLCGDLSGGVLHYNGSTVLMSAELPAGARNARFFRNGIVFNDSRTGVVRYAGSDDGHEDRALAVPYFDASDHQPSDPDEKRRLKRGFAQGLAVLSDRAVAGGSTPAAVSIYDLQLSRRLAKIQFSKNVREAVHSIAPMPAAL